MAVTFQVCCGESTTSAGWDLDLVDAELQEQAVQLEDGPSAGYHGYWITDFTQIDPHLGTNELRTLVDAAHARGMKVYFDIITNHTADVIGYQGGRPPAVHLQGRLSLPDCVGDTLPRP
jgi:hypothetical protein